MGLPPSEIHELQTLVLSFHAAVAIESSDEGRIETLLRAVGRESGLPVFEWSLTRGLVPTGSEGPPHGATR